MRRGVGGAMPMAGGPGTSLVPRASTAIVRRNSGEMAAAGRMAKGGKGTLMKLGIAGGLALGAAGLYGMHRRNQRNAIQASPSMPMQYSPYSAGMY